MSQSTIRIGPRVVGAGQPVFVVAEISANHLQEFGRAEALVRASKAVGADAVKLQTYTPDTLTLDSSRDEFRISGGTLWDGKTLHDLYQRAAMPWEWHAPLKRLADEMGLLLFSSPFDATAVDLLESIDVPAYKIASFELVDLPLIRRVAQTGKPMIVSTGMASLPEIAEAVRVARDAGATSLALLKCTSAYPAEPHDMNLRAIPALVERFGVPVGLSDHTLGSEAPIAAVACGATIIEKHLTLSRAAGGPDAAFSLEPDEFATMVRSVRITAQALGSGRIEATQVEQASRQFRRSLFVVRDIGRGQTIDEASVRSIRPGHGLHTRHLGDVIGRTAACDISRGTPLSWSLIEGGEPAPQPSAPAPAAPHSAESLLARDLALVDRIEQVRTRNNVNWMDLLRIGLTHAPQRTKSVLARINADDGEIADLLRKLSE